MAKITSVPTGSVPAGITKVAVLPLIVAGMDVYPAEVIVTVPVGAIGMPAGDLGTPVGGTRSTVMVNACAVVIVVEDSLRLTYGL